MGGIDGKKLGIQRGERAWEDARYYTQLLLLPLDRYGNRAKIKGHSVSRAVA